jgi:hypothetical protein
MPPPGAASSTEEPAMEENAESRLAPPLYADIMVRKGLLNHSNDRRFRFRDQPRSHQHKCTRND